LTHVTNYSKKTRCMLQLHSQNIKRRKFSPTRCVCVLFARESSGRFFLSFIKMKISRTCSRLTIVISLYVHTPPLPTLFKSRVNSFCFFREGKISATHCKIFSSSTATHIYTSYEKGEGKLTFEEREKISF
jgi:hypothetical protein